MSEPPIEAETIAFAMVVPRNDYARRSLMCGLVALSLELTLVLLAVFFVAGGAGFLLFIGVVTVFLWRLLPLVYFAILPLAVIGIVYGIRERRNFGKTSAASTAMLLNLTVLALWTSSAALYPPLLFSWRLIAL